MLESLSSETWNLMVHTLDPVAPDPDTRSRLMAALEGPARYLPFCDSLSRHFDLPEERIKELFAQIDESGGWTPGLAPILGHLHFRPGARVRPLHGGFVRMQRGTWFPLHRHQDRELTFVLEGSLVDGDGRHYGPGEFLEMPAGSVHSLGVPDDTEALVALLHGKIDMLGR